MHPYKAKAKEHHDAKLKAYGGAAKRGYNHPDLKEDMEMLHRELKPSAFKHHEHGKPHKADGGPIMGIAPRPGIGRARKGGNKGHRGTNVNVVVAPRGVGGEGPTPMPVPVGAGAPTPRPLPPIAAPMAGPPPGGAPIRPPVGPAGPGTLPMKHGGKVRHRVHRAQGGKVAYEAGSLTEEGRKEKMRNYGTKAKGMHGA